MAGGDAGAFRHQAHEAAPAFQPILDQQGGGDGGDDLRAKARLGLHQMRGKAGGEHGFARAGGACDDDAGGPFLGQAFGEEEVAGEVIQRVGGRCCGAAGGGLKGGGKAGGFGGAILGGDASGAGLAASGGRAVISTMPPMWRVERIIASGPRRRRSSSIALRLSAGADGDRGHLSAPIICGCGWPEVI